MDTAIDLIILNNFHYTYNIASISELSSDHNPILLNFNVDYINRKNSKSLLTGNSSNLISLRSLHCSLLQLKIMMNWENLLTLLLLISNSNTYNSASKPINNKNTYFLPPPIQHLITQRN
ncbi:hypothetical protein CEXT_74091 [Caerostris extrusa]|uniref:RNA-directed DNA polymerase n=1 Tax=Caerostris extrusa TaxID=172846 RepID=A0AAV4XU18_CAEEX|nr:hypothetical protein CEXT_74091 [Caerostris extrusa]